MACIILLHLYDGAANDDIIVESTGICVLLAVEAIRPQKRCLYSYGGSSTSMFGLMLLATCSILKYGCGLLSISAATAAIC